ncbi:hypothetical protein BURMUCF1_A1773 [Burkholderia multivorans ATCC BAA-247]|nr:hypothetical protein BURMUCF1_A1773 [Burkholderia multivorans ATCC BAA-247]
MFHRRDGACAANGAARRRIRRTKKIRCTRRAADRVRARRRARRSQKMKPVLMNFEW